MSEENKVDPSNAADFSAGRAAMLTKKRSKVPVQFVPGALLVAAARALGEGAIVRGAFNWRENDPCNPTEASQLTGGIMRHLLAWYEGEEIDPDSPTGKHHLDGVAGLLAILLDCLAIGNLVDDRKAGPFGGLVLPQKNAVAEPVEHARVRVLGADAGIEVVLESGKVVANYTLEEVSKWLPDAPAPMPVAVPRMVRVWDDAIHRGTVRAVDREDKRRDQRDFWLMPPPHIRAREYEIDEKFLVEDPGSEGNIFWVTIGTPIKRLP